MMNSAALHQRIGPSAPASAMSSQNTSGAIRMRTTVIALGRFQFADRPGVPAEEVDFVIAGSEGNLVSKILGFTAVTCATINVVGGFGITDRMLRMFKRKETAIEKRGEDGQRP